MSPLSRSGKWITLRFTGPSPSGKTGLYEVVATQGAVPLGVVRWWGAWRKYTFFPYPDTLFEQDCLRDIAQMLVDLTSEHNAKVSA